MLSSFGRLTMSKVKQHCTICAFSIMIRHFAMHVDDDDGDDNEEEAESLAYSASEAHK